MGVLHGLMHLIIGNRRFSAVIIWGKVEELINDSWAVRVSDSV
jgi:hypothetical protein